jgi:adenylate cyclase class IV
VRKRRWLLLVGTTRIHLDRVERLGDFMELEVVLHEGQSDENGRAIAERLMQQLGLADASRLAGAYLNLAHVASVEPACAAPEGGCLAGVSLGATQAKRLG